MTDSARHARSLGSITRGAGLFICGLVTMNAAGFAMNLVLTRGLGADGYGVYAYTLTIVGTLMLVTTLGSDTSILRYIPAFEDQPRRQESILGLAYLTALLGGVTVAVALYVWAPRINALTVAEPPFVPVLRLFTAVVVVGSLVRVITSTFRAFELLEYEVLTNKVVRPASNLGCVAAAVVLGGSVYGVMTALAVASLLGFFFATYLLVSRLPVRPRVIGSGLSSHRILDYYRYSLPLTVSGTSHFFKHRVDILLLGVLLSSTAVGVYNVALLLASALAIPLAAFSQLFPPVVSRLHATSRTTELNDVYSVITRWSFTISLIVAIVVAIYRDAFLAVFGPAFVAGKGVLLLLVLAQLVNSATGPSTYLLMMTGHQYVAMANTLGFGALNAVLTVYLVNAFGVVGAGLATFLVLVALNLTKLAEIRYLEGLFPYSVGFLKPLLAGAGAAGAMLVMGSVLDGLRLLVLGPTVGVAAYLAIIIAIGVEPADKRVVRQLVAEHSIR